MSHALKRTTAQEIVFALPLISGEYLFEDEPRTRATLRTSASTVDERSFAFSNNSDMRSRYSLLFDLILFVFPTDKFSPAS
jgi:hypothetical protein